MQTSPAISSPRTETRQRLLEAAGEVFAERGFRDTTIREICRRARANLAAVNYHFGDKERLYAAVIEYAHAIAVEKYPLDQIDRADLPADRRLGFFIQHVMQRLFDEGTPALHGRMMAREMIEPTAALDVMMDRIIRPMAQRLRAIVGELLGPGTGDDQVRLCQLSIIGQCLHHRFSQPLIQRLFPEQRYGTQEVKALADHITRFSLGALKGLAASEEAGGVERGDKEVAP